MTTRIDQIDQIVFRWTAQSLLGLGGVGPYATSLTDRGDLREWDEALALRITRASDGNNRPALAYLRVRGRGVIVHKIPARDDKNRPGAAVAHVLIGSPDVVDATLALGLEHWGGWAGEDGGDDQPGRLPTLDAAALRDDAEISLEGLRKADAGPAFVEFLTTQLADPAAPVTVVQREPQAAAMLVGLLEVLGPETLTFAINEDDDTAPDLPRVVFLDSVRRGTGYGATRRRIVIGDRTVPVDDFAQQLAGYRHAEGTPALAALRAEHSLTSAAGVAAWRADVFRHGHIMPVTLLETVTFRQPARTHLELLGNPFGLQQLSADVAALPDAAGLRRVHRTWRQNGLYQGYPAAAEVIETALIDRLLREGPADGSDLPVVDLGRLDARVGAWAAQSRAAFARPDEIEDVIRRALALGLSPEPRNPGLGRLLERLPFTDMIRLADRLTVTDPILADLLLRALTHRALGPDERRAVHAALAETEYLMLCIPRLVPDPGAAADRWRQVLDATLGPTFDRRVLAQIQDHISRDGAPDVPPAFIYALRHFADDLEAKAAVDQLAARELYRATGLPDIWPERKRLRDEQQRLATARGPARRGGAVRSDVAAGAVYRGRPVTGWRPSRQVLMWSMVAAAVLVIAFVAVFALGGGILG